MIAGIVKNWDKLKGWGFIKGDDGIDYFLHISKIRTGQVVRENTQVKFDVDLKLSLKAKFLGPFIKKLYKRYIYAIIYKINNREYEQQNFN